MVAALEFVDELEGEVVLLSNTLMGGAAARRGRILIFSKVTRMGSHIFGILEVRKLRQVETLKWKDSR